MCRYHFTSTARQSDNRPLCNLISLFVAIFPIQSTQNARRTDILLTPSIEINSPTTYSSQRKHTHRSTFRPFSNVVAQRHGRPFIWSTLLFSIHVRHRISFHYVKSLKIYWKDWFHCPHNPARDAVQGLSIAATRFLGFCLLLFAC